MEPLAVSRELWNTDFIIITLSNLFAYLAFHMLIPTLPLYVADIGGDSLSIGMLSIAFSVSAVLIRPVAGNALDTFGRKQVLFVGLVITLAMTACYAWVSIVVMVILIRFIHGIGWGITTTALGTIASDTIPQYRLGEGLGYFGLAVSLAMVVAPLIAFWLYYAYGFSSLILWTALLCIISVILPAFLQFQKADARQFDISSSQDGLLDRHNMIEKSAVFPSILCLLTTMAHGGVMNFIALFGKEIGILNVSGFLFISAAMTLIVRPVGGRILDKKGPASVILPGSIGMAVGLLVLSYSHSHLLLGIAGAVYGIGFGVILPAIQTWLILRVPLDRRGIANAMYFSSLDIGIASGALLLGGIATMTSYAFIYRFSVFFPVLVFLLLVCRKRNKEESVRP